MSIKDILAKFLAGTEELTDEERAQLVAYDPDATNADTTKALKESEAKAASILARKNELTAQVEALTVQVNEATKGQMTELEQANAATAAAEAKVIEITAELETERGEHAAVTRQHAMDECHGTINWKRDVITDASSHALLSNALSTVEDMSDKDAVDTAISAFRAANPALIAADIKGGTGLDETGKPLPDGTPVVINGQDLVHTAMTADLGAADKAVNAAHDAANAGVLTING